MAYVFDGCQLRLTEARILEWEIGQRDFWAENLKGARPDGKNRFLCDNGTVIELYEEEEPEVDILKDLRGWLNELKEVG